MRKFSKSAIKYWKILGLYAASLCLIIFIALSVLWSYAKAYEGAIVDSALATYLEQVNKNHWNDNMQAAAVKLENDFMSGNECASYIKETIIEDISSKKSSSSSLTNQVYDLYEGKQIIGQVSLIQDDSQKAKFNLIPWKVTSQEFNFDYLVKDIDVSIPAKYTVELNGVEIPDKYIVEKDIHYDVLDKYYAEYKGLPTKVNYKIEGYVGNYDLKYFDENGEEVKIDPLQGDSQFIDPCGDEILVELETFANSFVEAYYNYFGTSNADKYYPELKEYVKTNSDLRDRMDQALSDRSWIHTYTNVYSNKSFNSAFALASDFYVINYSLDISEYSDYWTADESCNLKIIVVKDTESKYGFYAVETE